MSKSSPPFSRGPLKSFLFNENPFKKFSFKNFSFKTKKEEWSPETLPPSPLSGPHSSNDFNFPAFSDSSSLDTSPLAEESSALLPPLTPLVKKFFHPEETKPFSSSLKPLELKNQGVYQLPPLDFLKSLTQSVQKEPMSESFFTQIARELEEVLKDFGVKGEITAVHPGPVVTLYELKPAAGTKSARVIGLADDIARSLSAVSTRVAVVPGKNVIGIELPNTQRATVYLKDLLAHQQYEQTTATLSLVLGKDISGAPIIADLARMPHLLVAGTTGSGKSVAINTMILSLLYRLPPEKCKFIMIDPKMLELSVYDGIPHLLSPVVTDPKKAIVALKWVVKEMENRYRDMSKLGVRNIAGYNMRLEEARERGEILTRRIQTGFDAESGKPLFEDQPLELKDLPFIVVIVDEMADLMLVAGKEIESAVQRLAQMARAAGIHLIMATQRPSVDVITGTIKANFPTRISFQVTSKIDSRTILGEQGAEQLLGQGDMLYMTPGGKLMRVHGPYTSDEEVEKVVKYLKAQAEPQYDSSLSEDIDNENIFEEDTQNENLPRFYQEAVDLVLRENKVSTSFIQRHFSIGYNSAAKIVDTMEKRGVISAPNHTGKREILG
jgi:S-DNA-T family DNA segregation ATPase FtsK/SpoIIIE